MTNTFDSRYNHTSRDVKIRGVVFKYTYVHSFSCSTSVQAPSNLITLGTGKSGLIIGLVTISGVIIKGLSIVA